MKERCTRLRLVHSDGQQGADQFRRVRLRVITVALVLAALVAAAAQWARHDAAPVRETAAQPQVDSVEFDYFPRQFVNQATEAEEHVQGF